MAESARIAPASAIELCRLLSEPARFSLMAAVWEEELCVCELQLVVQRPQNLVSHHLGRLRRAGLVQTRRDSQWTYYRPADNLAEPEFRVLEALLGPRGGRTSVSDPLNGQRSPALFVAGRNR